MTNSILDSNVIFTVSTKYGSKQTDQFKCKLLLAWHPKSSNI